jgi:hypothetical protein
MVHLSEATRATAESQREAARVINVLDNAARTLHHEVSLFRVDGSKRVPPSKASRYPDESVEAVPAL